VPERAALSRVEGVLDRAVKVTSGRLHSVSFDLNVKGADGWVVTLTLPESQIGEDQVKSLLGRPVVALYSGPKSGSGSKIVWEFGSGSTRIVNYDDTRRQHIETQAAEADAAPYVGGAGLVVSLIGVAWVFRQRRTRADNPRALPPRGAPARPGSVQHR
jgi:hypothetical protein